MDEQPKAPPHVEQSVAAIAELHRAHYRAAGSAQRGVSAAISAVARPRSLVIAVAAAAVWIGANLALGAAGAREPDPYPFPLLGLAVSSGGLLLAVMILIAQRHDDELATRRDQLTLELSILADQKTAKVISLLEELRRADPFVHDRFDGLAEALAEPVNPNAVLNAIQAAHQAPEKEG